MYCVRQTLPYLKLYYNCGVTFLNRSRKRTFVEEIATIYRDYKTQIVWGGKQQPRVVPACILTIPHTIRSLSPLMRISPHPPANADQDLLNIYFSLHPERMWPGLECPWNFRPDHCLYGLNCMAVKQTVCRQDGRVYRLIESNNMLISTFSFAISLL